MKGHCFPETLSVLGQVPTRTPDTRPLSPAQKGPRSRVPTGTLTLGSGPNSRGRMVCVCNSTVDREVQWGGRGAPRRSREEVPPYLTRQTGTRSPLSHCTSTEKPFQLSSSPFSDVSPVNFESCGHSLSRGFDPTRDPSRTGRVSVP